jgi:hypothetical protein
VIGERSGFLLALVLFGTLCAQGPSAQTTNAAAATAVAEAPPLAKGQRIERELAACQAHTYRLALATGDFFFIVVAQQGIDVVATLIRPDGSDALKVNAMPDPFREEVVVGIADAGGSYTLVVRPTGAGPAPGRYRIAVDELRPATASDRDRVKAERAFEAGDVPGLAPPNQFPKALEESTAALALYRDLADRRGELKALIEVAGLHWALAHPQALAAAEQAERLARDLGDEPSRAAALRIKRTGACVRLHDIYNLRLDADLVVLSACQTALGKEIKGEGLVGLTRAFMYAGAPRVVASLWEVSDAATAELMKRFYQGVLDRALQPAAALRAAQLEISKDPRWSAPYYWAGFVLQGDWK